VLREIVIGSPAFWCPETPNYVVGVCDELVIVAGHSRTFVWAIPDGTLIAVWPRWDLRGAVAIDREGDVVVIDERHRRLRVEAATGATVGEEATAPPAARMRIDNARTAMTLTMPDGAERQLVVPWTREGCVARDGGRYALDGSGGPVRVYDAETDEGVYVAARGGTPTLSADGRYLVVSLLGPPRTWIEDIERGVVVTPAEPPSVYSVTLGHAEMVIVDDGVWSVAPVARVATIRGLGTTRVIRGEHAIGITRNELARWRLRNGEKVASIALPARGASSMSVDAAGRFAALTLDDSHGLLLLRPDGVWLADLDAGTLVRITDDTSPANVAINPAGDRIAIVDEWGERIRVVDQSGATLMTPPVPAPVRWAQFSPDGERLLVVGYARTEEQRLAGGDGDETAYLVDSAGTVTTVGAGTWRGWLGEHLVRRAGDILEQIDPATGQVLATAAVEPAPTGPSRDGHVGLSETRARVWLDERRIALSSNDGCLRLRDLVWRTVAP
jgi:hypothetical protein